MRYIRGLEPGKKKVPGRGKIVGTFRRNSIYEKPADEVKQALNQDKSWTWIKNNILKKYYPNYKKQSINSMTSVYKNFVLRGGDVKKPFRAKRRLHPPKGAIAKSETYSVWIMPDDVRKVKSAISHYGLNYKPTVENIIKLSGLAFNRVRGTIDVLKKQGKVKLIYTDDGTSVYHWVG
jgi:hypothetical protein